jgi:hypothetical protein
MSVFHLHVHTGRGLGELLAEGFALLESGGPLDSPDSDD